MSKKQRGRKKETNKQNKTKGGSKSKKHNKKSEAWKAMGARQATSRTVVFLFKKGWGCVVCLSMAC